MQCCATVRAFYRVVSLTWPASMQVYCNQRKRLHKKRVLVWDTNMGAVSLFWYTNMAAVTSCENTLYKTTNTIFEWRGGEGVWILLFPVVTLFECNVSTILSPIFAYITIHHVWYWPLQKKTITYHNALCLSPPKFYISIVFSFSWELNGTKRNWKQWLCKILGWQTKSIMVCYGFFLEWSTLIYQNSNMTPSL